MIFNDEELAKDNEIHIDEEEINDNDKDSADELDELENQLDDMYHQYQARKLKEMPIIVPNKPVVMPTTMKHGMVLKIMMMLSLEKIMKWNLNLMMMMMMNI